MARKKLHLYVWTNVLADWTDGIAFALASSKEAAVKLVVDAMGLSAIDQRELENLEPSVLPVTVPFGGGVRGGA